MGFLLRFGMLLLLACTDPVDSAPKDSAVDTAADADTDTDTDTDTDSDSDTDTDTDADTDVRIDDAELAWTASLSGDTVRVDIAPDASWLGAAVTGGAYGAWSTDGAALLDPVDGDGWAGLDIDGDSSTLAAGRATADGADLWSSDGAQASVTCGLGAVTGVSWRPGTSVLALAGTPSGGGDAWCLVDTETDQVVLSGGDAPALDIAVAPIGTRLAVLTADAITLYDMDTGEALFTTTLGAGGLESGRIAWYRDGDNIAVASPNLPSVWKGRSSTGVIEAWFSATYCNDITFSDDGKWLALGFETGTVSTASVLTGEWQWSWFAHDLGVTGVRFNADATQVVTGGRPAAISVWDLVYR